MSATNTGLSLDVSQLKLLKSLKQAKPEEKDDSATPALDMKRMIEQLFEAKYTKPVGGADADPRDLAAEIKVDGKPIDKIYNSRPVDPVNAFGPLKPGADGAKPDPARNSAEDIAEAAGGKIPKTASAAAAAAPQPNAPPARQSTNDWDAIEREKQQWFAGIKSLRTIGDPSMLVRAQLFAQQGAGVEA